MVTFLASIAMLQSAIQIAGDGGARVKLDIPDDQMDAVMQLMAMRGEVLRVTVETEAASVKQMETHGESLETRPKRKPKWTTTKGPDVDRPD